MRTPAPPFFFDTPFPGPSASDFTQEDLEGAGWNCTGPRAVLTTGGAAPDPDNWNPSGSPFGGYPTAPNGRSEQRGNGISDPLWVFFGAVPFLVPIDPTFRTATAKAVVDASTGKITAINVTDPGNGYGLDGSDDFQVSISDPGGGGSNAGAIAHADATSRTVTSIRVVNPGIGYDQDKTVVTLPPPEGLIGNFCPTVDVTFIDIGVSRHDIPGLTFDIPGSYSCTVPNQLCYSVQLLGYPQTVYRATVGSWSYSHSGFSDSGQWQLEVAFDGDLTASLSAINSEHGSSFSLGYFDSRGATKQKYKTFENRAVATIDE